METCWCGRDAVATCVDCRARVCELHTSSPVTDYHLLREAALQHLHQPVSGGPVTARAHGDEFVATSPEQAKALVTWLRSSTALCPQCQVRRGIADARQLPNRDVRAALPDELSWLEPTLQEFLSAPHPYGSPRRDDPITNREHLRSLAAAVRARQAPETLKTVLIPAEWTAYGRTQRRAERVFETVPVWRVGDSANGPAYESDTEAGRLTTYPPAFVDATGRWTDGRYEKQGRFTRRVAVQWSTEPLPVFVRDAVRIAVAAAGVDRRPVLLF